MTLIHSLSARDVPPAAALHCRAFRGYANVSLGQRYIEHMFRAFIDSPRGVSLGSFGQSQNLQGYVVGVPMDRVGELGRRLLPHAIAGVVTHPWVVIYPTFIRKIGHRFTEMFARSNEPPWSSLASPVMGLFGIAVDPSATGQGMGSQLMEAFEHHARSLQMMSMVLSVFSHNTAACSLYRRCGWNRIDGNGHSSVWYFGRNLNEDIAPNPKSSRGSMTNQT